MDALSAAPAPPSAVVLIKPVSVKSLPPEMLTTASSTVPALSRANTTMRLCTAETVPKVDPDDTTTETGDEITRDTTVPLVKVADLKSSVVALSVTVRALAATDAVIDLMADSGTLVNDPPPSKVKVSAVIVPVAVTVVALTVVMLPVVLLTVVIVPVVAASVVNAPVLGAVLPIGGGEANEVTKDR